MKSPKWFASHVIGFRVTAAVSIAACVWAAFQGYPAWLWASAFACYFVFGCLGVVVTHHRYLSHRSFTMARPVEILFSVFGALAGTGSALGWVMMHMAHHKYSDGPLDPHSPNNGLWKMLTLDYRTAAMRVNTVKRIIRDPLHRTIHAFYHPIILAWLAFLTAVGGIPALLFIGMIPMALTAVMSNVANYGGHAWGYRNFDTKDSSVNNPVAALLTWGEGWHNNHHKYPRRPSYRCKWWEIDISGIVIHFIRSKA